MFSRTVPRGVIMATGRLLTLLLFVAAAAAAAGRAVAQASIRVQHALPKTVEIAKGVEMPLINLGTWQTGNGKPSDPRIGVLPWLRDGGKGLDCAWDYFNQGQVAQAVKMSGLPRSDIFITTKIPGIGKKNCNPRQTPLYYLPYLQLMETWSAYRFAVVIALLHMPIDVEAQWKGLEEALAQNLTRSIGISNFNPKQISALLQVATTKPAVNQCDMSLTHHDDKTIAFSQAHDIVYEAWGAMKGCDFTNPTILSIANAHSVTAAQICLRWVIDRGCIAAVGTGSNTTTVPQYTKEDLDVFNFTLSTSEMEKLNNLY